jgi:predicted flap endonuclease-1-like 5' DNA nuclease
MSLSLRATKGRTTMMHNTAPLWMGVAAIAGLVAIVGTGVAYVLYDFGLNASVFVGAIAAGIAAVALWIGWAPAKDSGPKPVVPTAQPVTPITDAPIATTPETPVAKAEPATPAAAAPANVTETPPTPVQPATPAVPDPVLADLPPVTPALVKPDLMTAPRNGAADDLKLLKGVGPKLEQSLHQAGIYHFDQIASWTAAEAAWVDDNIDGVRGRATRDDWVAQARALAGTV